MNILDLKFYSNDLYRTVTVKEYFYELLKTFWEEKENFSGKRPLGNSDWDGDLIKLLIENELISGTLDQNGYIDDYDYKEADEYIINNIIKPIFFPK